VQPNGRRARAAVALAVLATAFCAAGITTAPVAIAATTQSNACLGVTGGWTTFAVPIAGSASPTLVASGAKTTLSGVSVSISVDATLITAGVNTGLVQAAGSLAEVGTDGGNNGTKKGENAVTAAAGAVSLRITGTNTTEGTQAAANAAPIDTKFWVVSDGTSAKIYTGTPNPPTNSALTLVPSISVSVPLADTSWTSSNGGAITLAEENVAPSNTTAPTVADKNAAPLKLLPKINGAINVPFYCWPGTQNPPPPASGTSMATASSTAIATVNGGAGGSTTTTAAGGTTTTTAPGSTTTTTAAGATTTTTTASATTTTSAAVTSSSAASGTRDYKASCTNSLTPDKSELGFTLTGVAPGQVTAGSPVTLTQQSWKVAVPGQLLDTGINLGLLTPGATVSGAVQAGVFANNTKEGVRTSSPVNVAFGPIAVNATSGLAAAASATFAVPDMTWTSVGGPIGFEMAKTVVNVSIGTINVVFTCEPTTHGAFTTTGVSGATGVAAASRAGQAQVAGVSLARTGRSSLVLAGLAIALLDLGYLFFTSSRRPRLRRR
jgi:hypothetical protein